MSTVPTTDNRFGLVRTFAWVLWSRPFGYGDWRAERSSDDRDFLEVEAMRYASDRVRVLPMGEHPEEIDERKQA